MLTPYYCLACFTEDSLLVLRTKCNKHDPVYLDVRPYSKPIVSLEVWADGTCAVLLDGERVFTGTERQALDIEQTLRDEIDSPEYNYTQEV